MNENSSMKKQEVFQYGGISGSALKWIAIISMAIDHIGSGLLSSEFLGTSVGGLYSTSRLVGRIALPIFAFLLVQGYQHTSNQRKYLTQLLIFALISEIPYDLAFYDQVIYLNHQNIFFTLALGLIGLALFERYDQNGKTLEKILALAVPMVASQLLFVDYGMYGIVFIYGLGFLRNDKKLQTIFGVIMGIFQLVAYLAFIPIWFYNGKRGKQNKWFFYIFYPAHLVLIYLVRVFFY